MGWKLKAKDKPESLIMFDGRENNHGKITHKVSFTMDIDCHSEEVKAKVTEGMPNAIVLGLPWLKKHNPIRRGQESQSIKAAGEEGTHAEDESGLYASS